VKKLIFKNVWILSKAEKKGISLSLSPGVNLLTGENDVGKSTLVKSLYHCLGADTPQLNNSVWKKANPIYCVYVEIAGDGFYIVRDEKYFGVFNARRELLSRYVGVTGEKGIAHFLNQKLDFNIELERQADSKLGIAGPAFYFLPFYVDQDEGWSTSWSSFVGLRQFSNYRKLMIEYHLGVRPQSYYDAKKKELDLKHQLSDIEGDRVSMQAARDSVQKRKQRTLVDLDPAAFRQEMEEAVDQYNAVYDQQQEVLSRLKDARNQRNTIDGELELVRRAIAELEGDYRYAESPDTPEIVDCPTCGTGFTNSFVERFGILDDIDHCHALVDQWLKRRSTASDHLQEIEGEYAQFAGQLSGLEAVLARTKHNVTLSEVIASEGMKEMVRSLNNDINQMLDRERVIQGSIDKNAEELKVDSKRKREIVAWYKARMKEFLNALNVGVLSEEDYKTLDKQIKLNALGSDLPRSLLAQYFAFLHTMDEFTSFVLCPMIIDSPFQQEQDPANREAILEFTLSKRLKDQQMILATISLDEFSKNPLLSGATKLELDDKLSLLQSDQYDTVLTEIGELHGETLASPV
jgi:energy-coupling factor transporter ATP-binding protein EcfA2